MRSLSPTRRIVLSSIAAFVLYGGWAVFANWSHGLRAGLLADLAQGSMSFLSTALLTTGIEKIFAGMSAGALRYLAAATIPITLTLLLMAIVHRLAGTPEIAATMAPSILIGYLFSFAYAGGLARARIPEVA